jgi:AAA domain-containing protein
MPACGTRGRAAVINFWDSDPELRAQGKAERERHRESKRKTNGADPTRSGLRFRLIAFGDIELEGSPRYIVKNLIPRGGLVLVWGPPKCGKSFFVSDLALHVALGWAYRGRRVEAGVVLYVTCEGQSGFPARIEAFRQIRLANDATVPPFHLLPTRLDLVREIDELIADIGAQLGQAPCVLIVIDTLNRSLAGSESKDEDMSGYVRACDRLREAFRSAVIVIHHCGVDGNRPRGHTSLTGAVDAQIAVKRDKSGNIVAIVEYMKDGPEGDEIVSRLEIVDVGVDEDGEPIVSCVIKPADARPKEARTASSLSPAQSRALELLTDAITRSGIIPEANHHIPPNIPCVTEAVWRKYCDDGLISDSDKPDSKRKAFKRVSERLLAAGRVGKWGELVWVIQS